MDDTLTPVAAPRPTIVAGSAPVAIVPTSFDEFWRVATVIAASGLAPEGLKTQEAAMVALMYGAEMGLTPMQSLKSIAVIKGTPCLYADGLVALARRAGVTINQEFSGEPPDKDAKAIVTLTRPDGEEHTSVFTWNDAITAGLTSKDGPWRQYPKRMMMHRARSWAIRDAASDLLGSVPGPTAEELMDVTEEAEVRAVAPRLRGKAAEEKAIEFMAIMDAAETLSALQDVWNDIVAPFEARLPRAKFDGLSEHYAQCEALLQDGAVRVPDLDAGYADAMREDAQ